MAVELNCVDELTSVGKKKIIMMATTALMKSEGGVLLTTMMATIQLLQKWATTIAATVKVVPTKEKSYHLGI